MLPLHPMLVHFPVALLTVAAAMELVALLGKRDDVSRMGWWLQLLGTIGLAAAVITGILAGNAAVNLSAGGADLLEWHREMAFIAASAFAALLLWRVAARTRIPGTRPAVYVALFLCSAVLLLVVAWFGGELVFRYGLGLAR